MGKFPVLAGFFIALASLLASSIATLAFAQTAGEILVPAAIDPAALLQIQIADDDLNRDPSLAEAYTTNSDLYYTPVIFASDRTEVGQAAPNIVETGPNTGVFEFTLQLVTDISTCRQGALGSPNFQATGGQDPQIGVCPADRLSIVYRDAQVAGASASTVSQEIQIASWDPTFSSDRQWYGLEDTATVTILDLDANLNLVVEDTFEVLASPASSNVAQTLTAYETGPNTGIFQVSFEVLAVYGEATAIDSDYITMVYVDGFPADYAHQEEEFLYRIGIAGSSPPGGIVTINSGSEYTNDNNVQLAIACDSPAGGDQCYEMRVSVDGTFDTEAFEGFAASKAVTVPEGDGEKTVSVQFRSADGIISPGEGSDSIILDTTAPPAPTILSNGFSNDRPLALWGDAEQGTGVEIFKNMTSIGTTVANSPWSIMVELAEGAHSITAIATDKAGNMSPQSEPAIIVMDYSPPSGTAMINLGKEYAYSSDVTLQLSCSDAVGCSSMQVSQDGVFDAEAVEPFVPSKQVALDPEGEPAVVHVQFIDSAGNMSPVASDSILLVNPVIQVTSRSGTNPIEVAGTFGAAGLESPAIMVEWGDGTETAASISRDAWQANHDYGGAGSEAKTIIAKLFDSEGNEIARESTQLEISGSGALIAIIAGAAAVAAGAPLGLRFMRKGKKIARSSPRIVFDYGMVEGTGNDAQAKNNQAKFAYASSADQNIIGEKIKEALAGELQNESNIRKLVNELKGLKEKRVKGYAVDPDKILSQLATEGIVRMFDEINPYFASLFLQGISFEAEMTVKKEGGAVAGEKDTMLAIEHDNRIIKFKPNIDMPSLEPYVGAALSLAGKDKIPIFRLVFKIHTGVQIGGIRLEESEGGRKRLRLSDVSFAVDPYISGLHFGSGSAANLLPVPIPLPDKSIDIESVSVRIE